MTFQIHSKFDFIFFLHIIRIFFLLFHFQTYILSLMKQGMKETEKEGREMNKERENHKNNYAFMYMYSAFLCLDNHYIETQIT